MPNLNLDMGYPNHRKTRRLCSLLGPFADALPVRLWCYVGLYHHRDGLLRGYTAKERAAVLGLSAKNPAFVKRAFDALVEVGFLDIVDADTYRVHDWEDRAGHLKVYSDRAKAAAEARWSKFAPKDHDASSIRTSTASSSVRGMREAMPRTGPVPHALQGPAGPSMHGPACGASAARGGSGIPTGRDPFGPDAPTEVRSAAEKRRIGDEWFDSGGTSQKPEPWLTALSYGPDSRSDERERLMLWEGGDDEAFTRHAAPREESSLAETGPTP